VQPTSPAAIPAPSPLPLPGSRGGCCARPCIHAACEGHQRVANNPCDYCHQPIGFGTRWCWQRTDFGGPTPHTHLGCWQLRRVRGGALEALALDVSHTQQVVWADGSGHFRTVTRSSDGYRIDVEGVVKHARSLRLAVGLVWGPAPGPRRSFPDRAEEERHRLDRGITFAWGYPSLRERRNMERCLGKGLTGTLIEAYGVRVAVPR